ncbi:MAG: hypothetical protein K6C09_08340 [Oscillospiraceae bacterium]|nr:hypothetical protein [Oscillospiraceae bacterium]
MKIPRSSWLKYIQKLSTVNQQAASAMQRWMDDNPSASIEEIISVAFAISNKYGDASAALTCEMYDALASAQGVILPSAEPAPNATIGEIRKAIYGTLKNRVTSIPDTVSRRVKMVGADTLLKNARRDGAEFAWIAMGDTCVKCLIISSAGWRRMSKKAIAGDHAEHIHANCDCEYCVRFDGKSTVEGYDPEALREKYESFEGTPKEKENAWRREIDAEKRVKENINTPTDVTAEYFSLARPGKGKISYGDGYDMGRKHESERAGAQWIHDTLGGDIILLKETNKQHEKTPDYLWRGRHWDWKNVTTSKAANSAVRHALQQIRQNPGGVLLNYPDNSIELESIITVINERMKWNRAMPVDIIIIRGGNLEQVLRYNQV